jgi:SAM-dependent methyltransferase
LIKRTTINFVNDTLSKNINWKILDIGCGYRANKYASVIADVLDLSDFYKEKRFIKINEKRLPFKDKEFDFVIASHVIEHVEDFEFFLKELERISTKGYIELPTRLGDNLVFENKTDHIWWFTYDDTNNLIIASKRNQLLDPFITVAMAKIFEKIFRESLVIELAWEERIEYKIDNKIREEEKGTDFQAINPDVTWGEVGDFVHNRFKNFPAMTGKALMDPAIALGDFVGLENKDFMRAAQRYSMSLDEDMAKIREDDPESIKKAIKESAGKTIPSRYTALGVGIENLAQIAPGLGYGKLGQAAAQSKTVKKLFKAKPEVDAKTGAWKKKQGFSDKTSARIGGATAGLALGSGQIASETRQMTKEYLSGLKNNEGNPLFDDKQIEEFADNVVDKALYISGLPNAALSAYGLGPAFMKTDDGGMKALFKAAMKAGVTDMVFESIQEPFQGAAREEAMRQDIDPSIDPLDPSRRTQEALLALGPGFTTGSLRTSEGFTEDLL